MYLTNMRHHGRARAYVKKELKKHYSFKKKIKVENLKKHSGNYNMRKIFKFSMMVDGILITFMMQKLFQQN